MVRPKRERSERDIESANVEGQELIMVPFLNIQTCIKILGKLQS